jgi:hypothetical protein
MEVLPEQALRIWVIFESESDLLWFYQFEFIFIFIRILILIFLKIFKF